MIERKFPNLEEASPTRFLIFPVWLLALYAVGSVMTEAATIFLWIVCAFFLFVILDPLAEKLKARKWPTVLSAMLLILIATFAIAGVLYGFGYLFSGMVIELQKSKQLFMHAFNTVNTTLNQWKDALPGAHAMGGPNADVSKVEVVQGSPLGGDVGAAVIHSLGSAATVLTFSLLCPILAFFFLAERDSFAKVIARAYQDKSQPTKVWQAILSSTRAFFVGNLVLAAVTYPVFLLVFWLFSVPSIFSVAALATFFNLIPFVGAVLSGFAPAVTLYTQNQVLGSALGLYASCVAIHFAVADFVTPKVLGSKVDINATTSTIALVAWGELWGGVGLILAIPLTSVIKILFENSNYFWLQWIAGLMSEDVAHALKLPTVRSKLRKKSPDDRS